MVVRLLLPLLLVAVELKAQTLEVMFYNLQNLFDYRHDEGKNDWQFLPLDHPGKSAGCRRDSSNFYLRRCLDTDWNQQKFNLKISQIAKVVKKGGLPDILGVCEIENQFTLAKLAEHLGYDKYVMTASPDQRGADVALLYRRGSLVYQGHHEHRLPSSQRPTRNLLEVEFRLPRLQEQLLVYVLHWPAPRAPSSRRMASAKQLIELIQGQLRRNRRVNILVIGDFNVIPEDHPHPFRELFDGQLSDARQVFFDDRNISRHQKQALAPGTYFYPRTMRWQNLDRIFFNANLADGRGLEADQKSFKIVADPEISKDFIYQRSAEFLFGSVVKNVPLRYDFNALSPTTAGYSDHFAVRINLVAR